MPSGQGRPQAFTLRESRPIHRTPHSFMTSCRLFVTIAFGLQTNTVYSVSAIIAREIAVAREDPKTRPLAAVSIAENGRSTEHSALRREHCPAETSLESRPAARHVKPLGASHMEASTRRSHQGPGYNSNSVLTLQFRINAPDCWIQLLVVDALLTKRTWRRS